MSTGRTYIMCLHAPPIMSVLSYIDLKWYMNYMCVLWILPFNKDIKIICIFWMQRLGITFHFQRKYLGNKSYHLQEFWTSKLIYSILLQPSSLTSDLRIISLTIWNPKETLNVPWIATELMFILNAKARDHFPFSKKIFRKQILSYRIQEFWTSKLIYSILVPPSSLTSDLRKRR
jgi:hypothetical protein